jgi:hypothetical protein
MMRSPSSSSATTALFEDGVVAKDPVLFGLGSFLFSFVVRHALQGNPTTKTKTYN